MTERSFSKRPDQNIGAVDYGKFVLSLNGIQLSNDKKDIFFDHLNKLNKYNSLQIYRGDNKDVVLKRYNNSNIPNPFNDYIYLYGTKGRHFLKKKQRNRKNKKYSGNISDISSNYFGVIYDQIKKMFTKTNHSSQEIIDEFQIGNQTLYNFFSNKNNRIKFLNKVKKATFREKKYIRDYYLTLLHHFQENNFYHDSFLLSTSKNYSVAYRFSGNNGIKENKIIFFGWVPKVNNSIILHQCRLLKPQIGL